MLKLFGNKSDHPLANIKSAQQLLESLSKTHAVEVLQEMVHWIEELLLPANEFRLDHQFAVLRLLDDAAHPHLRRAIHSYFSAEPPAAFQENRLWGAMNSYFTCCEQGYRHLLTGLHNGNKGSSAIKSFLPLICARGIYAIAGRLECAAVRYAQIDPDLWAHLAEFYAYAEEQKCLDEQLAVYSGLGAGTSARHLFATVLMWYGTGVGSRRPLDLHIAKRLLTHAGKSFTVDERCIAGSLFYFDLASPSAPTRVKEEDAMYPASMRFIGSGEAARLFDDMLRTLAKNMVPEELNMGVAYNAEMVGKVARQLAVCCHSPLPSRRHQRRKIKMNLSVANGFAQMVEQTAVDLYLDDAASESWDVENVSANGFSCVLPAGRDSKIRIGALVGMQPEKVVHWGVGIVRRMSRDARNNLHVGVEMLATRVQGAVLHGHDGLHAGAEHPALFLDKSDMQNDESWVLMKAGTFSSMRSSTMTIGEESYLLLPLGLLEKGDDYDLARYRRMVQDSGEELY